MRFLYSILFCLGLPFFFLRLWFKGCKAPAYRLRWAERLGHISKTLPKGSIWIHAVSVGEVIVAKHLIATLQKQYPKAYLVLTTTTPSGSKLAKQLVGDRLYHCYFPYDIPSVVRRFLNRVRPVQAIFMETELWPNVLHEMARRNIRIFLANARLSHKSMRAYAKIASLTRSMLSHLDAIGAQTNAYAERFINLGADPKKVRVMGNMKFEVPIPQAQVDKGRAVRLQQFGSRPTWVAASTHAGEETLLLAAFKKVRQKHPRALLILVPRHIERTPDLVKLCQACGYVFAKRTQRTPYAADLEVLLGDTLGELCYYYGMADIAFVGGSLVPVGGHNPLEPAALQVPVITGSYVFNFTDIFNRLAQSGGLIKVQDVQALTQAFLRCVEDTQYRRQIGNAGYGVIAANRGATNQHMAYLNTVLARARSICNGP